MMENLINVGHDQTAIKEMRETIIAILEVPVSDNVKETALNTLVSALSIGNITLTGCTLHGDATHTHHHFAEPEAPDETVEGDPA